MFNKTIFNSLMTALSGMFVPRLPHDKPAKRYPSMVVSSPYAISAWNEKVEAGKISRKGHRHA